MGPRILAAVVGLAALIPLLLWGGWLGVSAIVALVMVIALDEYALMAVPEAPNRARALLLPLGLLVHGAILYAPPQAALPALAISCMAVMIAAMFLEVDVSKAATQAIRLGFGLLYIPPLMATLVLLRREDDGLSLIFLVLAVAWLGDTGAYFAGRFFGKTPLFPRVSPKKTVEGLIGGVILATIGAMAMKPVGGVNFSFAALAALGLVLDLAGVVGDLAESMLKRAFGVKDSGWIMPGHGGILDRIDSLMFCAPLLWAAVLLRDGVFG